MSIATQITRIQTDRNTIRNKLVALGLATGTDNLDVLAEAIDNIQDNGNVSVNLKEGETYTIPAGFHSGSGTVSGVAGGGNYSLQSKTVTPTKKTQNITSDDGYYGLSDVTVNPIPDAYQDVTSVTAAAGDVLTGKVIVSSTGVVTAGSMVNNGSVAKTLTTSDASYTVPVGYHNGTGIVKVVPEDKSVTPTEAARDVTASTGKVLNKVTVAAIPSNYGDASGVTIASPDAILSGVSAIMQDSDGSAVVVAGSMNRNGPETTTLDTTTTSYTIPIGYHEGTGKVQIVTETKSVTPTKSAQDVTPTSGKVLSKVSVAAIPDAYQDVTSVTATADKVLYNSVFVAADGTVVEGTMPNVGAFNQELSVEVTSVTIPAGYHNGGGEVSLVTETKTATPTKSAQTISATSGKVLSQVTVNAIPDAYQDVTEVDAVAANVLTGKKIVTSDGTVTEGTMANNGAVSKVLDATNGNQSYTVPVGYHDGTGAVSISLETKSVTPTKSAQDVTPTSGKVLSKVSVAAIPDAYQDVTSVTAEAAHVLEGKTIVAADGTVVEGSMPDNGHWMATIDGLTTTSVDIPVGYMGDGHVELTPDIANALAAI